MRIFLAENGLKTGPFLPWEVRARLERGEVGPDTLGWHDGCESWLPLRDLPALGLADRAPPDLPDHPPVAAAVPTPAVAGQDARPRPWQRFAARSFDLFFWLTVIALALEPFGNGFILVLTQPLWVVGAHLLMFLAEAVCLTIFGTTPGKAVLGLRVAAKGGAAAPMAFPVALHRTALVFLIGNPSYIPGFLITVCAWIFHHVGLMKHGETWWDRKLGTEVLGMPMTWRRGLAFAVFFILLDVAMNMVAGDEIKRVFDEMMNAR